MWKRLLMLCLAMAVIGISWGMDSPEGAQPIRKRFEILKDVDALMPQMDHTKIAQMSPRTREEFHKTSEFQDWRKKMDLLRQELSRTPF